MSHMGANSVNQGETVTYVKRVLHFEHELFRDESTRMSKIPLINTTMISLYLFMPLKKVRFRI